MTLTPRVVERPVRVEVPQGKTTKLVLPWRPRAMKVPPAAIDTLGFDTESVGTLLFHPPNHPARARLVVEGPDQRIILLVVTVAEGAASEIRFIWKDTDATPPPAPALASPPGRTTTATLPPAPPERSPRTATPKAPPALVPSPAAPSLVESPPAPTLLPPPLTSAPLPAPSPAAASSLDMSELIHLSPVAIGREEGLPGQRPMVLVDALKGQESVWLRFTLRGGARERVEEVTWEHGAVESYMQQAADKDLRVIVRLPRAKVAKKTKVSIKVKGTGEYKFPLSAPWFSTFLRSLF